MKAGNEIILMIEEAKRIPAPVGMQSNLYTDLGLNSLDFISLLVSIEDTYSVSFGLEEVTTCLQVDQLISLVEAKMKERDHHA